MTIVACETFLFVSLQTLLILNSTLEPTLDLVCVCSLVLAVDDCMCAHLNHCIGAHVP